VYFHPTSATSIDGAIVEMRCADGCVAAGGCAPLVRWELVRVRDDRAQDYAAARYFGNDYRAAELAWINYIDPFPIEQLWNGPGDSYFMAEKNGIYEAQVSTLSFIKTERIMSFRHAMWVVDVGAGRGQDLGRYFDAEIHNLVAIDQDRAALAELVRRKHNIAKPSRGHRRHSTTFATAVYVLAADATQPHASTAAQLASLGAGAGGVDVLVCNLALHYFLGSVESMRNFAALAQVLIRPAGFVSIMCLFGEAVHAEFVGCGIAEGEAWNVRESGALKFSLKRMYSSSALEIAGQRIGVLLPFSGGRYYEEYLVNTTALTAELQRRGFRRTVCVAASTHVASFRQHNPAVASRLTAADKKYLALYGELLFQREAR
jgi:NAD(P)-dependent dehydrogenase (short-subunit alcohol dehydrogenase family)